MSVKKRLAVLALAAVVALGGVGTIAQSVKAAKIEGTVDNVTANKVIIEGLTIFTDNNTKIEGTLSPGVTVKVKTTTGSDGSPLAVSIVTRDESQYTRIKGTVDNITGNKISIDGQIVFTDNNTRIEGTLAAGKHVTVKAKIQGDGSLLAVKIEVNGRYYVKLEGIAANVTATSLKVNRNAIKIDDSTRIVGKQPLENGAFVKVQAITQSDGSLLAVKIQVFKPKAASALAKAREHKEQKGNSEQAQKGRDHGKGKNGKLDED